MDKNENAKRILCGLVAIMMPVVLIYGTAYLTLLEKRPSGLARYSKSKSINIALASFFRPANAIDRVVRPEFWGMEYDGSQRRR